MSKVIKDWWLTMSRPVLERHLADKLRYPAPIVAALVDDVMRLKQAQRGQRIKRTVGLRLWDEFYEAPRYELATVRVLKAQYKAREKAGITGNPSKWDALCTYEGLIATTIARIKAKATALGATPATMAHKMHAQGHSLPRNNGLHWTDYVKQSDMDRVKQMFARLPPPTRGRQKEPFSRTLPPAAYRRKKAALIERLTHEIEGVERELAVHTDPEEIGRLEKRLALMYRAQHLLDNHKHKTPLPATWHGLVGEKSE